MSVGFTGTQRGMSPPQRQALKSVLLQYSARYNKFHHGMCVGAADQAAEEAYTQGFYIVGHPGHDPWGSSKRGSFNHNHDDVIPLDVVLSGPRIVDCSQYLVANPNAYDEVLQSRSWATRR